MEAPEKIYLVRTTRIIDEWRRKPSQYGHNIEYTRTDVFIEKACEFLSNKANIPLWEGYAYTFGCDTTKLVDEFRKYMKGE